MKPADFFSKKSNKTQSTRRIRRRWRVEIVNENTLERTWSIVLSGVRVWLAAAVVIAAVGSLIAVIFTITPLGRLLPGHLDGDLRARYLDATLRVDSLETVVAENNRFLNNIVAVLGDELADSVGAGPTQVEATLTPDSLLEATEAERMFVQQFDADRRYSISVLAPIAAQGMIFESPSESTDGIGFVNAIYRGTVVSSSSDAAGFTIAIQHPNDFISVYSGLDDIYITVGEKVSPGRRIGRTDSARPLRFELWHDGNRLNAEDYLP